MSIALWPAYVLRLAAGIIAIQNPGAPVSVERATAYAVAAAYHGVKNGLDPFELIGLARNESDFVENEIGPDGKDCGLTQTRTTNQQNEITSISGAGAVTYDANGNVTADGSGNSYVYDAWNRLVKVNNGGSTLAAYGYDGLGRRITETHGATTTDLYLSAANQVLEERVGGVVQARNVWSPV